MHQNALEPTQHDHVFGQDQVRPGERRTLIVIGITLVMMVVEIVAGLLFGSMALLADGLHMGSHATALGINAFAYVYARRHARDRRFTFGTGKVNALGGFSGAVLLAVFALIMAGESIHRLIEPVTISFNQAILVAVLGLIVNGSCVLILGEHHHHGHQHEHEHDHDHDHDHGHHHHHDDHNLRSAYFHVLADALTSVTAIFALLAGKYFGWVWMDPLMGIVGSLLVGWWSFGLLKATSQVLLDHQADASIVDAMRASLEVEQGVDVSDLHVWSVGPGIYAAAVALIVDDGRSPTDFKDLLPDELGVVHATFEVHRRQGAASSV